MFIVIGVGDRGGVVCRRLCMLSSSSLLPPPQHSGTKSRADSTVFIVGGVRDCGGVVCGQPCMPSPSLNDSAGGDSGTKSRAGEASGGGDSRPGTMSAMWNLDIVVILG